MLEIRYYRLCGNDETFDAPWEIIWTLTPLVRRTLKACKNLEVKSHMKSTIVIERKHAIQLRTPQLHKGYNPVVM